MRGLLWAALPLVIGGFLSCTSLPGGVLALVAWQLASDDLERLERGELAPELDHALREAHQRCRQLLGLCAVTWLWQGWVLSVWGVGPFLEVLGWFWEG